MKKIMIRITTILFMIFVICMAVYCTTNANVMKTMSITFGVTLYHFAMRLFVGCLLDKIFNNRVDYTKKWFQVHAFELSIYKVLRVKKWKKYMPTFESDYFDIRKHSLEEITSATCQSEIVHETIILLSFVPIILSKWFGSSAVFVITSIVAALFDMSFVIIQRFNRFRLLKMIKR